MKAKIIIILGCFALLSGCATPSNYKTTTCSSPNCQSFWNNSWNIPTCGCTDPNCRGVNNCYSQQTCCAAFGNIGDR